MNCSAQMYSTRSTVNGEGVHWENAEGSSQNMTVVANISERFIVGAVCDVKWYEVLADRLRSPNGGGMYECICVCMVITCIRVWINRIRLPILLVVS